MSGSNNSTSTTTQASVNQIPQWVQNAGQANYGLAQQVASQPLQQYQGQMVADVAPQTQQAWNLAANSGNVGQDALQGSQAGLLNSIGYQPSQVSTGNTTQVTNPGNAAAVTAGNIGSTNLQPYMDPYTQDVINNTLPLMQQQNALSQNQAANQANSANAFGGSRQGVQQGVAQAQGALNVGQMAAQLNQANFGQAQAAATNDINRQLQAATTNQQSQQTDLARQNQDQLANQAANAADLQRQLAAQQSNQTAGLTANAQAISGSQDLGNLGIQQQQANVANYGMLTSAGAQQQQQAQNQINAQIAKFQQAYQYPQQQLGMMESSLGMTPYDTAQSGTSTTNTQQTQSNPAALALGGLQSAASVLAAPMTGGGSVAGSLLSGMVPSD